VVLKDDVGDVDMKPRDSLKTIQAIGPAARPIERTEKAFQFGCQSNSATKLANGSAVAFVEEDSEVTLSATQTGANLGAGPHRSARSASQWNLQLQRYRFGRKSYYIAIPALEQPTMKIAVE